jgi:hypothetical protein
LVLEVNVTPIPSYLIFSSLFSFGRNIFCHGHEDIGYELFANFSFLTKTFSIFDR